MQYKCLLLFILFLNFHSYSQIIDKKGITIYEYSDSASTTKINTDFLIPDEIYELGKGIYKVTLAIDKDCRLRVQTVRKNQNELDKETLDIFQKTFSKISFKIFCNDQYVSICEYNSFVLVVSIYED